MRKFFSYCERQKVTNSKRTNLSTPKKEKKTRLLFKIYNEENAHYYLENTTLQFSYFPGVFEFGKCESSLFVFHFTKCRNFLGPYQLLSTQKFDNFFMSNKEISTDFKWFYRVPPLTTMKE